MKGGEGGGEEGEGIADNVTTAAEEKETEEIWLGQVYAHTREALSDTTWQKSIVSTR